MVTCGLLILGVGVWAKAIASSAPLIAFLDQSLDHLASVRSQNVGYNQSSVRTWRQVQSAR